MKKLLPITLGLVTILLIAPMAFAGSTPKDLKQFTASPTVTITDIFQTYTIGEATAVVWDTAQFQPAYCDYYIKTSCGYAQVDGKFYLVDSVWNSNVGKSVATLKIAHGGGKPGSAPDLSGKIGGTLVLYY